MTTITTKGFDDVAKQHHAHMQRSIDNSVHRLTTKIGDFTELVVAVKKIHNDSFEFNVNLHQGGSVTHGHAEGHIPVDVLNEALSVVENSATKK